MIFSNLSCSLTVDVSLQSLPPLSFGICLFVCVQISLLFHKDTNWTRVHPTQYDLFKTGLHLQRLFPNKIIFTTSGVCNFKDISFLANTVQSIIPLCPNISFQIIKRRVDLNQRKMNIIQKWVKLPMKLCIPFWREGVFSFVEVTVASYKVEISFYSIFVWKLGKVKKCGWMLSWQGWTVVVSHSMNLATSETTFPRIPFPLSRWVKVSLKRNSHDTCKSEVK